MITQEMIIWWIGLSIIVGLIAKMKNKSIVFWIGISVVISPLIAFIAILLTKKELRYYYEGNASLANEAYCIYLTNKFNIEKIETIGKFKCTDRTFGESQDALVFAHRLEQGIAEDVPLDMNGVVKQADSHLIENNQMVAPDTGAAKNIVHATPNTAKVSVNKGSSSGLILIVVVLGLFGLFYLASSSSFNFKLPAIGGPSIIKQAEELASRTDVSELNNRGSLARAFNLNSKFTDLQRENLLKDVKNKVIVWVITIYEIKRDGSKYTISTPTSLFDDNAEVNALITLTARDANEEKFIAELKTGQTIRIKGILTGESFMRSLMIEPAILWYPEEVKKPAGSVSNEDNSALKNEELVLDNSNVNKAIKRLVIEYKKSGIAGSSALVGTCYDEFSMQSGSESTRYSKFEQCASMDLAAYRIDTDSATTNNFPPSEYFSLKSISDRLDLIVNKNIQWKFSDDRIKSLVDVVNPQTRMELQEKE